MTLINARNFISLISLLLKVLVNVKYYSEFLVNEGFAITGIILAA